MSGQTLDSIFIFQKLILTFYKNSYKNPELFLNKILKNLNFLFSFLETFKSFSDQAGKLWILFLFFKNQFLLFMKIHIKFLNFFRQNFIFFVFFIFLINKKYMI
jgi:hypothetical protein